MCVYCGGGVFNATFNNISVKSWIIGLTVQNTGSCLFDFFLNSIGGVMVRVRLIVG